MGIRPSSTASSFVSSEEEECCFVFASYIYTARLIRIVRLVRLRKAAKGQELLASSILHRPSRIVRLLLHQFCLLLCLLHLFCLLLYYG